MKRVFPFLLLVLAGSSVFGQVAQADKPVSKIEQFSTRSGGLIEKRFIDVGSIKISRVTQGQVKIQSLIVTDLVANSVLSGVRFEYVVSEMFPSDRKTTKTAFLDADEVDGLIKSINFLKMNVFDTTKEDYTEVEYTSRAGFSAGAFFTLKEKKWSGFLKLAKYDSDSSVFMDPRDFDRVLELVQLAKEKLK
ncbi:MAG: hypothetical protein ABL959_18515 [Pyrinomonadaceae bacterium]